MKQTTRQVSAESSVGLRRRFGVKVMAELADLGFQKGVIVETLVSTYNADRTPNAAPMGISMEKVQTVTIRIFTTSSTFKNLKRKKCAVINITSDIEVFYRTTFKEVNPKSKVPPEWFEKAETVDAPKLRIADAVVEVSVVDMKLLGEKKVEIVCNVELIRTKSCFPKVHCRAFSETLEAIIHATRVKTFLSGSKEQQKKAMKLLKIIENCCDIVNRVAPNSCYSEIMANLEKMIGSWRSKT